MLSEIAEVEALNAKCEADLVGRIEDADSAIGLMLALTRGITLANTRLRDRPGEWNHYHVVPLSRLCRRVLGIVGLGRIGTAVAIRGKALGMDVVFFAHTRQARLNAEDPI